MCHSPGWTLDIVFSFLPSDSETHSQSHILGSRRSSLVVSLPQRNEIVRVGIGRYIAEAKLQKCCGFIELLSQLVTHSIIWSVTEVAVDGGGCRECENGPQRRSSVTNSLNRVRCSCLSASTYDLIQSAWTGGGIAHS